MSRFTILRTYRRSIEAPARSARSAVVTIPVRNEEENIVRCLDALAEVDRSRVDLAGVILALNGCTDDTWGAAKAWGHRHSLPLFLAEIALAPALDHAGGARASALSLALRFLGRGDGGIVLTTDADSRPRRDWLTRSMATLHEEVDVVAGSVMLEPACPAWPLALQWRHDLESEYNRLLDEIDTRCDPVPHNPWPAHRLCSGANLAFRAAALNSLPEIPAPRYGEDRAIVEACHARDLRVRHDPELIVDTSARLDGRAFGGMADTLRRRMGQPGMPCDPLLEPCAQHVYRAGMRAAARQAFASGMSVATLGRAIGMPLPRANGTACRHFGEAWQQLERAAPSLKRSTMLPHDLAWEIGEARAWLADQGARWTKGEAA
jgi:hypothetical protein